MRPVRLLLLPLTLALPLALAPSVHAQAASDAGTPPAQVTQISDAALAHAGRLREAALADGTGYAIIESLTTRIGPRLPGSEADARAVEWAKQQFKALGYDKVWTQDVTFPLWVRRSESAQVLGANAQPLVITALGGSPGGTVEAEVVRFATLEALEAAPAGSLAGRIAYIDFPMQRARDGSGYGPAGRVRSRGPSAAIRAGAAGYLMRSASTGHHRHPHTGITRFDEGLAPIPSAALSNADADQLTRLLALGPQQLRLSIDAGWDGEYTSQNVIGEITGRSRPDEVVAIGAHLDSWDLGTGAIDDASGIGITMAAGHLIGKLPQAQRPARTIRVIAFANEEQGLIGGRVYAQSQADKVEQHQIVAESDFGADRIYAFSTMPHAGSEAAAARIAEALAPLGIEHRPGEGSPGPDFIPFAPYGVAWATLHQDGTDYFDYHHTPDDTLDKIDPQAIAQNVAAYAVFAYLAAQAEGDFGSQRKDPEQR
ncbi:M28 family peptidase [Luteimonas sp. e5]